MALLPLAVAGCAALTEAPDNTLDCDEAIGTTYGGDPADVTAEVVVLVDVSESMWHEGGEFPDLAELISTRTVDEGVFQRPGERLLSVARFSGAESAPQYLLDRVPIAPAVGTGTGRQREDLATVQACLREEWLAELPHSTPASGGSDVLAAIASATRKFGTVDAGTDADAGTGTDRYLYVYTDGLVNAGCLDMERYYGEDLDLAEVAEDCAVAGEAPEPGLAGITTAIELQEAPRYAHTTEQRNAVAAFWTEVCAMYGGGPDCVPAPPGEGQAVPTVPADPPEVEEAEVGPPKVEFPPRCKEVKLPAPLLFAFDSAELREGGMELLDRAVEHCASQRDEEVTVTGHTDSKGPAGYNQDLSERRAQTVAAYLEGAGFTDVTAVGEGEDDLACAGDYDGDTLLDADCAQANRRVVIEAAA